jgi:hypothetical protein
VCEPDHGTRVTQQFAAAFERGNVASDVTGLALADEVAENGRDRVVVGIAGDDGARDVGTTQPPFGLDAERNAESVFETLDDGTAAFDAVALEAFDLVEQCVRRANAVPEEIDALASVLTRSSIPWTSVTPSRSTTGSGRSGWRRSWSVIATAASPASRAAGATSERRKVPSEFVVWTWRSAATIPRRIAERTSRLRSTHLVGRPRVADPSRAGTDPGRRDSATDRRSQRSCARHFRQ